MIAMVVDGSYQCLSMSDIPPTHKKAGKLRAEYSNSNTLTHISEGIDEWKEAIDQCLATQEDTKCELCNEFAGVSTRWRAELCYLEPDRVLATFRRLPSAIHLLTDRERDVLDAVATGKTNAQVAEALGISLSTVEKHRHHIRQTLNLSSEQELHLTAWLVANPDILHALP
ncbi:MAG: helix-turn-helix transcriptional regulator [Pirellulales bacterium]|nr:helix-turn-helix transcriptional regulator [Pirellulales bacterium]